MKELFSEYDSNFSSFESLYRLYGNNRRFRRHILDYEKMSIAEASVAVDIKFRFYIIAGDFFAEIEGNLPKSYAYYLKAEKVLPCAEVCHRIGMLLESQKKYHNAYLKYLDGGEFIKNNEEDEYAKDCLIAASILSAIHDFD